MLARLVSTVTKALNETLKLSNPICWTDSKVSLYWIQGETQEWKQFVENRVKEIRKLMPIKNWKHCPGKMNPADIASRGATSSDLQTWLNGPAWMLHDIESEGVDNCTRDDEGVPEECVAEMKSDSRKEFENTCLLVCNEASYQIHNVIDVRRYGSFSKLIAVTTIILRFIRQLKKSHSTVQEETSNSESKIAEVLWIKYIQQQLRRHPSFETWKNQFGLFWDKKGIIRFNGRISKADMPDETKHPIFVKDFKSKSPTKTWIALYTCAVTRALHLELVSDMTSESFLLCFRRFCARRGVPKRMISDNAKTFMTASRRLRALFQLPEVRNHMELKQIKWSFNTPGIETDKVVL